MRIEITNWKIVKTVQRPIPLWRELMFWLPKQIPTWFCDVEFEIEIPGPLRKQDVIVTDTAMRLYINRIEGNRVIAQTTDFVPFDEAIPEYGIISCQMFIEED